MRMAPGLLAVSLLLGTVSPGLARAQAQPQAQPEAQDIGSSLEVPYVPTPQPVVDAMLGLAGVSSRDKLYDLGSGDGRIVVTAAKRFGIRAVGVDANPKRIQEANENAKNAGVSRLVEFRQEDLFQTNLKDATVVTLYLLSSVNERLKPKLLRELKPGTRIVSHSFDMGDWEPERIIQVGGSTLYLWTVPPRE